jgi:hypothetical protein
MRQLKHVALVVRAAFKKATLVTLYGAAACLALGEV